MNDPAQIRAALESARTVAVVGCSPNPDRPSNEIARYLQRQGYRVVPINPGHSEILGERCYPSLAAVPEEVAIDIVDVFRRSEFVADVAAQTIARKIPFLFMQLGVVDAASARLLEAAGTGVAMDHCILVEHRRLGIPPKSRNAGAASGVTPMSRNGMKD
jgi:predicted CoA-binding protein